MKTHYKVQNHEHIEVHVQLCEAKTLVLRKRKQSVTKMQNASCID